MFWIAFPFDQTGMKKLWRNKKIVKMKEINDNYIYSYFSGVEGTTWIKTHSWLKNDTNDPGFQLKSCDKMSV